MIKLPYASENNVSVQFVDKFGGINNSDGTPLGEFSDLLNMTLDDYPAISTRANRYGKHLPSNIGMCFRNGTVYYVSADDFILYKLVDDNPRQVAADTFSAEKKTFVNMGAYLVILPDNIYLNIDTGECSSIEATLPCVSIIITSDTVKDDSGLSYTKKTVSVVSVNNPQNISNGFENVKTALKVGDGVSVRWNCKGKSYSVDTTISNITVEYPTDNDTVIVSYVALSADSSEFANISGVTDCFIERKIPKMDFVIELNNRLWGCSSENHEIYCCKLGEPDNWYCYAGISTDSYAATVATDGNFTGAIAYNNSALFFKENCLHTVYGTKAANFNVTTTEIRGVQSGSEKSICIADGMLYYKGNDGIYQCNGSTASKIDTVIGETEYNWREMGNGIGGASNNKLYMSVSAGMEWYGRKMYVLDLRKNVWTLETINNFYRDNPNDILQDIVYDNGILYAVTQNKLYDLSCASIGDVAELDGYYNHLPFKLVTGWVGRDLINKKYYSKIQIDFSFIKEFSEVLFSVFIAFDNGDWEEIYSFDSEKTMINTNADEIISQEKSVCIPIIPRRCNKARIMISGQLYRRYDPIHTKLDSKCTFHSMAITREEGTELG